MTRTNPRGGGRARASLALSLAATMLLGGALAANASSIDLPGNTGSPTTGSITINKYKKTDAGAPATGAELSTPPSNDPLAGVKFEIWKINGLQSGTGSEFDLTTDAGWQAVQQVAASFDPATFDPATSTVYDAQLATGTGLTDGVTGATTAAGLTAVSGLPLGLYYVKEVPGTAQVNGTGDQVTVIPIVPFLVTLPLSVTSPDTPVAACVDTGGSGPLWSADGTYTSQDWRDNVDDCEGDGTGTWTLDYEPLRIPGTQATSWSYDLYLYPKNDVVEVTKSITPGADGGLTANDPTAPIEYNITADLPAIDPGEHALTKFTFTDALDPRLTYLGDNTVKVTLSDGSDVDPLFYVVQYTAGFCSDGTSTTGADCAAASETWTGARLVVAFNDDGLDYLTSLAQATGYISGDEKVTMSFSVVANTETGPNEDIVNGGSEPSDPNDPTSITHVDIEKDHVTDECDTNPGGYCYIPPKPDTKVEYGGLSLWKYGYDKTTDAAIAASKTDNSTGLPDDSALAGAEFMVFASLAQANAYAAGTTLPEVCFISGAASTTITTEADCINADDDDPDALHGVWIDGPVQFYSVPGAKGDPGDYDGASLTDVATSAASGEVVIGGLRYGTYYVLETKAPAGYSLLAQPKVITISTNLDGTYFNTAGPTDDQTVPNVPANAGFPIPLTGGSGVLVFTLLALAIAGVTVVVLRKQKHSVA